MQTEGASSVSSRPLQEGNEAPVVTDQKVNNVEVPSSLALTPGSNLGAPLPESSTARNDTGNSSQSTCQRESEGDSGNQWSRPSQSPLRCQAVRHNDRVHGSRSCSRWSYRSSTGRTYRHPRAQVQVPIASVITTQAVLPRTVVLDLALRVFREQALVLSAAMARDPGIAIAATPGVAIAAAPGVATASFRPLFTL